MRRIVRRTVTLVVVQTWTVTWAEEPLAADPLLAEAAQCLARGPAPDAPETSLEAPRSLPNAAGNAG
jgi:hypothetical protein